MAAGARETARAGAGRGGGAAVGWMVEMGEVLRDTVIRRCLCCLEKQHKNIFTENILPASLPVLLGGDVVRRGEAGRGVGEGVARAGPLQGGRGRGRGEGGGGERGELGLGLAGIRNEIILIWS